MSVAGFSWSGRMRQQQTTPIWTGCDGEHRASYELTARAAKFLAMREGNGNAPLREPPPEGYEDNDALPFESRLRLASKTEWPSPQAVASHRKGRVSERTRARSFFFLPATVIDSSS
jgi:hypothetical protein